MQHSNSSEGVKIQGSDSKLLLIDGCSLGHLSCLNQCLCLLGGVLGWATYAAASALVGLVLGTVLFFVLHKVFGLGHGKEEGAH